MSRKVLIPVFLMGLLAACSGCGVIGPHRIDVQQGNALDQESVAKLKPGLNRSQVRFLLGTPLLVDPFRNDRWDYVYVYYKAGKLTEQKRITLYFDDDTLKRIDGDFPVAEPLVAKTDAPKPVPAVAATTPVEGVPVAQVAGPEPAPQVAVAVKVEPAPVKPERLPEAALAAPVAKAAAVALPVAEIEPAATPLPAPAPVAATRTEPPKLAASPRTPVATSIVPPLPSPKGAPAYVDPRTPAELNLQTDANVAQVQPDLIPPFPEPGSASGSAAPKPMASPPPPQPSPKMGEGANVMPKPMASPPHPNPLPHAGEGANAESKPINEEVVLQALKSWSEAWRQRNQEAYLAAYGRDFVAPGGLTRADWEKRRRQVLGQAKNIELKIDSPSVEMASDGSALVTFNQYYRSDSYRDAVVKQITMVRRDGRWLITEERVLSTLRPRKP
jgi:outer membrane protein assembly factor BamE